MATAPPRPLRVYVDLNGETAFLCFRSQKTRLIARRAAPGPEWSWSAARQCATIPTARVVEIVAALERRGVLVFITRGAGSPWTAYRDRQLHLTAAA